MNPPEPVKSVVAEAHPVAAEAPRVAAPHAAAKLEMLDGDEIIQVSIKPSLWFIPLVSFNVLVVIAFAATALTPLLHAGSTPSRDAVYQVLIALAALRLGIATLQWASRLYVLTNRRVMHFKGVLNVKVAECRLVKISAVDLVVPWYGRALRLGSIRMQPGEGGGAPLLWDDVARPQEIHELLVRAVRKSQSKD